MTLSLWITEQSVRDALSIDTAAGRYTDSNIGSNIRAAESYIQRASSRQFEVETTTKRFSTNGAPVLPIPDLTSATSITLQGTALTADESYWLHPDAHHSGVYVAVQLRQFGNGRLGYLANPEWFDRNLDSPMARAYASTGLPNDLAVTGTWGWAEKPDDLLAGVKALAAWLLKRMDAVLAGAVQDPTGAILDYSQWPVEARTAVELYRRGQQAVVIL